MPNFVAIGQTVAEISWFLIFPDGDRHYLGFLTFEIFNGRNGQEGLTALSRQISSKSLQRGRDMANFLGFSKFEKFNSGNG